MSSFHPRASIVVLVPLFATATVAPAAASAPIPDPSPVSPAAAPSPAASAFRAGAIDDDGMDGADDGATDDAAGASRAGGPSNQAVARQVEQFLHHIMMARPDLAAIAGEALVSDDIAPSQLAEVVDGMNQGEKLDRAIRRGRAMGGGVGPLVGRFETKLEQGRIERARETARMREAVAMLDGTIRQQGLARARLEAAGEYAVPLLLAQIVDGRNPKVEIAATDVLVGIGRRAVLPLASALPDLDPPSQRKVCEVLSQIGWPTAVPFLQEITEQSAAPNDVREAAYRGIARLGGARGSVSDAYASLARQFFLRDLPLIPYPDEPVNNVWTWDAYGGLTPTPVPTEIFSDVMAMRLAERALRADPSNTQALAVFVAANLRRQNDLPDDAVDPIYGDLARSPQFFATVVGPRVGQLVLSLALETMDTALVRDAIDALSQTGGEAIVTGVDGRVPIIECLTYPDRRVQYDAAVLLGSALPTTRFPQDTAVVPILASAVRTAGTQYAAVVAPVAEDQRQIAAALTENGFTVVGTASTWDEVLASGYASGMLDIVAARGRSDQLERTVSGVRSTNSTAAAPVLLVVAEEDRPGIERLFTLDRRVSLWTAGAPDETFTSTVEDLIRRTSGGRIDEAEAIGYAMRSLEVLDAIALSRSDVFRIEDGERSLGEALATREGAVRIAVANVMALIPTGTAQVRLLDAALLASGDDQADLLEAVAASGRRLGNHAEPRQVTALRQLVQTSSGAVADAAATAYGALGLPTEEAVKLILE